MSVSQAGRQSFSYYGLEVVTRMRGSIEQCNFKVVQLV